MMLLTFCRELLTLSHQLLIFFLVVSFVGEVIEEKAHHYVKNEAGDIERRLIGKYLVNSKPQRQGACDDIKDLKFGIHANAIRVKKKTL